MRIRREQALFLIVLALGVVLRVALLGNRGYESDLELFRRWAVAARADGFGAFARTIPCNYMPLYLEALRVLAWLGGHLGFDPVTSPATFVGALKVVPNLADLIAAGLLYRGLSPPFGSSRARLAAVLYFWNPAFVFDSAVWGQADAVVGLFVVAGFLCLLRERMFAAGLCLAFAILTKLQPVLLIAPFALFAWSSRVGRDGRAGASSAAGEGLDPGAGSGLEAGAGSREGRRAVGLGVAGMAAGMATATVLALAPFVLAGNGGYVWRVLIGSVDFQPRLAPGANNVWWLFFGEEAKRIWDGYRYLDALSYRETGLLALAGVALATIVVGAFTIRTSAKVPRAISADGPTFAGSGGRTNTEGPTSAGSGGRTNTEGPTSAGSGGRTNTEGPTSAGSRNRSSTGSISSSSGMSSQRQALDANAPVLAWRILFGTSFFLLFAFYVLPTQMHERYVIYCLPPLLFVWVMRTHGAGVLYGLLSVGAFVTIAANLVAAYPQNASALNWLSGSWGWLTRAIAVVNCVTLVVQLGLGTRRLPRGWLLPTIPIVCLVAGFLVHSVELRREGVPLSEIRPTETRQAVGTVHMNSDARGAPLMVRGEQVRTGLGTLAPSMIAYALDGRYSRLRTGVRVTSPAERATFASRQDESSAVDVSVLGDRVPLFQAQTRPDESDPVACDVDLHGVTELILLAQPASPDPPSAANAGSPAGPTSGRNRQPALVDWLDPRLIR